MMGKVFKSPYFLFSILVISVFLLSLFLPEMIALNRDKAYLDVIHDDSVNIYDREYPDITPVPIPQPSLESISSVMDSYHYLGEWVIATEEITNEFAISTYKILADDMVEELFSAGLLPHINSLEISEYTYSYRLMRMLDLSIDIGFWTVTMKGPNYMLEITIEEDYNRIVSLSVSSDKASDNISFKEYEYEELLDILGNNLYVFNEFVYSREEISIDKYPLVTYRINMDDEVIFVTIRMTDKDYYFNFETYYEFLGFDE